MNPYFQLFQIKSFKMKKIEIIVNPPNEEDKEEKTRAELKVNCNGFTHSLTCYQKVPIIYLTFMVAQLAMVVAFLEDRSAQAGVSVVWGLVLLCTGVMWVVTTRINPTDTIQLLHRKAMQNGNNFNMNQYGYFCSICQTCVSNNAFHCRQCNRCVEVFDHHCKWLNNCIGAKNYFEFIGLISCSELLLLLHMALNIVHCVLIKATEHDTLQWLFYIEIGFSIMDFIIFCFNTSLLCMHIYLIVNKKTTIELIKERRINQKIHPAITKNQNQNQNNNHDDPLQSEDGSSAADFAFADKKQHFTVTFTPNKSEHARDSNISPSGMEVKLEKQQKQELNQKKTLNLLWRRVKLQSLK